MSLPSPWPSYVRMLVARRPPLAPPGSQVDVSLESRGVVAQRASLAAYRRVCGFPLDEKNLPLTYPHVLASPLHLALIAGPGFPVRFLGLVHLRNTIRATRGISSSAALDLDCAIRGPRETERGEEYDLSTEVRESGELVWTENAVLLARRPGSGGTKKATAPQAASDASVARLDLPRGLGRRYALASGDFNPIHLSATTARMFGFPRAIMHGMWSLARCVAELSPLAGSATLNASFKLPVFLPATVSIHRTTKGSQVEFSLRDEEGKKPHLLGSLEPDGNGG